MLTAALAMSLGAGHLSEIATSATKTARSPGSLLKPPRLRQGDTVGLVIASSAQYDPFEIDILLDALRSLDLVPRLGRHVGDRRGHLAGRDEDRAADLNAMFADPQVRAIHCIRGGSGAARILPLLDYPLIARHPKPLVGYSDVTALLLAIHARTGLVTFHGPNGSSEWNPTNVDYLRRVMVDAEQVNFVNPQERQEAIVQTRHRIRPITTGVTRGRLLGGNLTVLTALMGSDYLPEFRDAILFLEDVDEAPYRIDRMLTQLKLAGVLGRIRGFVWGTCTRCNPGEGFGSLTITDILDDHIKPLGIPAYQGAMIGHINRQFTLPVGIEVEIDAAAGSIRMLEAAVL
jgi:muramoyltetrapeptide carboxypeptidase